jgi:hypothetical protein
MAIIFQEIKINVINKDIPVTKTPDPLFKRDTIRLIKLMVKRISVAIKKDKTKIIVIPLSLFSNNYTKAYPLSQENLQHLWS